MKAYCWASGSIYFGRSVPEGAITIAAGPSKSLRAAVSATARHAYDGETLLVPGVPEAETEEQKIDALIAYQVFLEKGLNRRMAATEEAR